jgi:hypothetical protein
VDDTELHTQRHEKEKDHHDPKVYDNDTKEQEIRPETIGRRAHNIHDRHHNHDQIDRQEDLEDG